MKNKIKAWLLWDWDNGRAIDQESEGVVYFKKDLAEEYGAMPIEIHLTKEGLKEQEENDIRK